MRKNQIVKKLSKLPYLHNKKFWIGTALLTVIVIFWLLPAIYGKAPGQLGYSIKRGEETLASNLAPLPSWRYSLRLDFANNRVSEAAYVANQDDKSGAKNEAKTARTVNNLLGIYEKTYEARTDTLNQNLGRGKKPAKADAKGALENAVDTYTTLQLLRLQAPDAAQLAVLTAIDDSQSYIATLNDALGLKPLLTSDLVQLAKLVSIGVVSKSQVDQLMATAHDNRRLHAQLVNLVVSGQLPSDITYTIDQDLVKQIAPTKVAVFETVTEFEQLQRISAVVTASRPTATQKQAIETFLASYKPGQSVPSNDIQPYAMAVVYGWALAGKLQIDLPNLNSVHMSSDDQALFDKWKGTLDPPNLSDTYRTLMSDAQSQPELHLRNLTRMQAEFVDAQKAQVAYLVMPPGWNADRLGTLDAQMGVEIAEVKFQASNPSTNQELARLTSVQQQLQTALNTLNATYTTNITVLQSKINNFNGAPEQLAQLKDDLASLSQDQTTTVNNLQTQITQITDAHTKLGDAINSVRIEQITNLAALELRAATHAKALTDTAKTSLTSSLAQIENNSQTLINSLTTRINNLDASQTQLRQDLTGALQTVQDNYIQLETYTKAQLDAGVATSASLATDLQNLQTTIADQTSRLAGLGAGTTALSQLVNQVKDTSQTQADNLQNQINNLQIDQQAVKASLNSLKDQQAADTAQLTSQLADLSVLQIEAQATIADLAQGQVQAQANISHLSSNFDSLQSAFDDSLQAQVTIQADIASQQSGLDSLNSQTQAALNALSQQQSQLSSQINSLTAGQANLSQTVSTIQTASNATQAQLNTILANPPWSIPAGTYVTQNDFDSLAAQLDSQFTQLSTQLNSQFQSYQQTLNGSVNQINSQVQSLNTTVTNTANSQSSLQNQVNNLNSQVQTLQNQIQQLLNAAAPHTGL